MAVVINATAENVDAGNATTIATAATMNNLSGSLLVVAVRSFTTSITVTGITDTAGNTYHFVDRATSSVTTLELWYAYGIASHASNTITASFSSSVGSRYVAAIELTEIQTGSDPFDVTAKGTGSGGTVTTGSYTTSTAAQVVVVGHQVEQATPRWQGYTTPGMGTVMTTLATGSTSLGISLRIVNAILSGVTTAITCDQGNAMQAVLGTFKYSTTTGGGGGGSYGFA